MGYGFREEGVIYGGAPEKMGGMSNGGELGVRRFDCEVRGHGETKPLG